MEEENDMTLKRTNSSSCNKKNSAVSNHNTKNHNGKLNKQFSWNLFWKSYLDFTIPRFVILFIIFVIWWYYFSSSSSSSESSSSSIAALQKNSSLDITMSTDNNNSSLSVSFVDTTTTTTANTKPITATSTTTTKQQQQPQQSDSSSSSSMLPPTSATSSIVYKRIEETTNDDGNESTKRRKDNLVYQKYRAYKTISTTNNNDNNDMKEEHVLEPITVQEWIERILLLNDRNEDDWDMINGNDIPLYTVIEQLVRIFYYKVPYRAYFMEFPPITFETVTSQHFEFVIVQSEELYHRTQRTGEQYTIFQDACETTSNHYPIATSIKDSNKYVCVIPNINKDAILVIPQPIRNSQSSNYTNLAPFMAHAGIPQINTIWKVLAATYQQQIISSNESREDTTNSNTNSNNPPQYQPVWLSTSGLGVSWLHFRFDSYPKYYSYQPYKKFPMEG